MIETIIKAVLGIIVVVGGWLTVQLAWRRFSANTSDCQDRSIDRGPCHPCCRSTCDEIMADPDTQPVSPSIKQTTHQTSE